MMGALLIRGMLAGLIAGLFAFVFATLFGEPQVNWAIAFETHMHQLAHEPPEPELISRAIQSTLGLLTGTVLYSTALGGIFALVFAYAFGRIGQLDARATAFLIALAGLLVLIVVPQIKYPANPPSIGNPATIGPRTSLYFEMIAASVIAAVISLIVGRRLTYRIGAWNASLAGAALYVAIIAIVMIGLPAIDEVPPDFSATTLWKFRLASLVTNTVVWTTIGLAFGALTKRRLSLGAQREDRRYSIS